MSDIYPCPDCEFCKKPKTWEETKYVKCQTFMNKDACPECHKNKQEEADEEDRKWLQEQEDGISYMTIYNIVKDMKVGDLTGTYYQTYGGGPEGGFLLSNDNKRYELDRTWYQPWKVTRRSDIIVLFKSENHVPYEMQVIIC